MTRLLAELKNEIHFDRIIGQNVTVEMGLANEKRRYFNGLVKRFSQGARDELFVHYRAELFPKFWLLKKNFRTRIFQHLSVPDILRQVLQGLDSAPSLRANGVFGGHCSVSINLYARAFFSILFNRQPADLKV